MGSKSSDVRVACVQMRSGLEIERNLHDALALIAEAAGDGATLVATPEMTTLVDKDKHRARARLKATPFEDVQSTFAAAARAHGIWLHVGSVPFLLDGADDRIANRGLLFSPDGDLVAHYDKIHMFDVDLASGESWRESNVYKPGERAVVADAGPISLGLTICYDVRFPGLYRRLAQSGATMFVVPAAFTQPTGKAHWETLLRARAIETGSFVMAPAQGGVHEDGRATYGHSMIIGPWGDVAGQLNHDEPGVLMADLDLTAAAKARQQIPSLKLESAYEIITVGR